MRIYGLKNCDSCRASIKALEGAEFVDIRDPGIAPEELAKAYAALGDALINTRSTTWRQLSEEYRAGSPLELMQEHPTLIKRPLIVTDTQYLCGWGKPTLSALGLTG